MLRHASRSRKLKAFVEESKRSNEQHQLRNTKEAASRVPHS
jgi:hypothetical protein